MCQELVVTILRPSEIKHNVNKMYDVSRRIQLKIDSEVWENKNLREKRLHIIQL